MIIAIPTDKDKVSGHFGRSRVFTFYEVEDKIIKNRSMLDTVGYLPCHLPGFFKMKGVDCVIGGNMGVRSQGMFKGKNIDLVLGVTGGVDDVIQRFIDGTLEGGDGTCEGHEGHGCHHGHQGQNKQHDRNRLVCGRAHGSGGCGHGHGDKHGDKHGD